MPKIIQPLTHRLALALREKEQLQEELKLVKEENRQLNLAVLSCSNCRRRKQSLIRRKAPGAHRSASEPTSTVGVSKSFASPTVAFRARLAVRAPTQEVPVSTSPSALIKSKTKNPESSTIIYQSGKLLQLDIANKHEKRFMMPTESSRAREWESSLSATDALKKRRAIFHANLWPDVEYREPKCLTTAVEEDGWPESEVSTATLNMNKTATTDPETCLADRTRLYEFPLEDLCRDPKRNLDDVLVRGHITMALLSKAHKIAVAAFWVAAKVRWPEVHRSFPDGPTTISTSYGDMADGALWVFCSDYRIRSALESLSRLRNKICHPNNHAWTLAQVDYNLKVAQTLTVTLDDEVRSFKILKIRQQLATQVQRGVERIEALEPFTVLPFAQHRWKPAEQRLFDRVKRRNSCSCSPAMIFSKLPHAIVRVALTEY
ncbi:hypothetical protein QBC42DRAFT_284061 [Cladorrhinum samala]|uniref:Uncharacterized protein n=1 Tax=Cladorrhinum samala TaxID=585594 RepID=A0AAV9HVL7_9PEZI|nr:hypothetical protein QBC42DRAFT_284061 [Cladorrhinum samala]